MIWGQDATIKETRAASPLASSVRASSSCRNSQVDLDARRFCPSQAGAVAKGAVRASYSYTQSVAVDHPSEANIASRALCSSPSG